MNEAARAKTRVTSVANVNKDRKNSGLPLRGLAMVLIAVAVLLGLWGLYALTQDETTDTAATNGTETATVPVGTTPANGPGSEPEDRDPAPDEEAERPEDEGEADERGDTAPEADERDDAARENRERAQPPARPGGAGAPAPAPERVNVLNNSTVPNLAAEISEELTARGYDVGEVGNLPDDVEILPETTVFFQPDNDAAEQRARELADRVGGVARVYIPSLPEETDGANDLTLVLVDQVTL